MRPVDQTTYGVHDGNCFSACVASILEMPIEAVPSFAHYAEEDFLEWLAAQDLAMTFLHGDRPPSGYAIAGGPSRRFPGRLHACVALDGIVIHDPHSSREGLPFGVVGYVVIHPRRG